METKIFIISVIILINLSSHQKDSLKNNKNNYKNNKEFKIKTSIISDTKNFKKKIGEK